LGMSVVLVSSAGPETAKIRTGEDLQYEIVEIPRSLSPIRDMVALVHLTQLFFRHRFDLVHSTTPKAGLLTALAAFITRVPIRFHTFTGQPWVTLKGPIRWASRMADRLIGILDTKCYADSGSQAHFLIAEGIISPRKMAVIGHGSLAGVDLGRFDPDRWPPPARQELRRELSVSDSSTLLIFVGRITPDKGISELLEAFSGLLAMNYDVDLLLIGPQDRDRGGVGSLDLSQAEKCPRIHAIGYSDCPERQLAIADIFCLPSYREGFGTVVMEAAAMGLPTVGTAIYGLTDAVADGETGILVPPRDAGALREALCRLLEHPDERIRMGKAARKRCLELFDAAKVNAGVAEEYRSIIQLKRLISREAGIS
jgi:glycosyltransferase involved in cell wall biosynthesis